MTCNPELTSVLGVDLASGRWVDNGTSQITFDSERSVFTAVIAPAIKWSVSSALERELNAALVSELDQRDVKVLPILHRSCDVPLFLRDRLYADFSKSYETGLNALLARVSPEVDLALLDGLLSDSEAAVLLHQLKIPERNRGRYETLLLQTVNDPSGDKQRRLAALTALFAMRVSGVERHLIALVSSGFPALRRRAIFYLGELKAHMASDVIEACLSDRLPEIRAEARSAHRKLMRGKL